MGYSFDGANKIISLTSGTTTFSVRDLWSRWVDWSATSDNSKYAAAFDTVGGDSIDAGAGTFIPIYSFLQNGWRIRPQEANHTLYVTDGILLVEGGGNPFLQTLGNYQVSITLQQPVQAISYDSGGTAEGIADALLDGDDGIETGLTLRQAIRLVTAAMAGRVSGAETDTVVIRNAVANTKPRITAEVDEFGNRTDVTTDLT